MANPATDAAHDTALAWAIELITCSQSLSNEAKLRCMAALTPKMQSVDLPAHLQVNECAPGGPPPSAPRGTPRASARALVPSSARPSVRVRKGRGGLAARARRPPLRARSRDVCTRFPIQFRRRKRKSKRTPIAEAPNPASSTPRADPPPPRLFKLLHAQL